MGRASSSGQQLSGHSGTHHLPATPQVNRLLLRWSGSVPLGRLLPLLHPRQRLCCWVPRQATPRQFGYRGPSFRPFSCSAQHALARREGGSQNAGPGRSADVQRSELVQDVRVQRSGLGQALDCTTHAAPPWTPPRRAQWPCCWRRSSPETILLPCWRYETLTCKCHGGRLGQRGGCSLRAASPARPLPTHCTLSSASPALCL